MLQVDCFGGVSVMVWAGIHHGSRTALAHVTGAPTNIRIRDEILQHHTIPDCACDRCTYEHQNSRRDPAASYHSRLCL